MSSQHSCLIHLVLDSVERLNEAHIKVNREFARCIVCNGGLVVCYLLLESNTQFYLRDYRVHLNSVVTNMCFLGIRNGIKAVRNDYKHRL